MSGPLGSQQWMYASGGFYDHTIDNSLRFESSDSAYLTRNLVTNGNRRTFTISCWVKRSKLDGDIIMGRRIDGNNQWTLQFQSGGQLDFYNQVGGSVSVRMITSAVFRDPSAWYHIVCKVDVTTGTSANAIYVNGVEQALSTDSSSNTDTYVNGTGTHYIGQWEAGGSFDGYMAEFNFIDGQALDASNFGETKSGIWVPKDTSGLTFGTNGFRLVYADSGAIGDDTSGNTNDWTANNLVASDVVLDSPTNNFGVMSSIDKGDGTATYSEGNLKVSVGDNEEAFGSFGMSSGKWYWEIRYVSSAAGNNKIGLGIADTATPNNNEVTNNGHVATTYAPNDILAVAVDVDNELFSFYKNGTIIETDTDWSAKGWTSIKPIVTSSNSAGEEVCVLNFGQDSTFAGAVAAGGNADENGYGDFAYAPPSGYLSLCSANLPSGAIDTLADETPEDYFNTVLYTGNSSTNAITGVGFQPDWTWIKRRSGVNAHQLYDAVRGAGQVLKSDSTNAEAVETAFNSFDADGFEVDGGSGSHNLSGETYASWNWKANGAGVSNTDGSITSTVSVGATSQQNWFSIVSYTGNTTQPKTVGHGLGVTPDLILIKNRDTTDNWSVYHSSVMTGGDGKFMQLNTTAGLLTDGTDNVFDTGFSSTTFGIGRSSASGDASNFIAYCFANAEGLCKVGSYTGNGSADGSFIFTGFRPAFVMWKRTDTTSDWFMMDIKRDIDNPTDHKLEANTNGTEVVNTAYYTDYLSNGFKLRNTNAQLNASGGNYIYLAIAEQPFKYANAR